MRFLKLNRRQKVVRNLLVIALCLFCMAWLQGFPVWSHQALLQRAAGAYLIDEPVELLYVDEEAQVVYGAVDGRLLRVRHGKNLFGMQMNYWKLYPEEQRYIALYKTHTRHQASDTYPLRFQGLLVGYLGEAATAEMEFTLKFTDPVTGKELSRETKILTGARESAYSLRFPTAEDGRDGAHISAALSVLRLYDENGILLEEQYDLPWEI